MSEQQDKRGLSTLALHADDRFGSANPDVAPPLHVSTTFRYPHGDDLKPIRDEPSGFYIYSRHVAPNSSRLETALSAVLKGNVVTYTSGLAAVHAIYTYFNPKKIAIGDGYHGCHGVIAIHKKLSNVQQLALDCAADELGPGDIVHLETPLNPTGEAYNIAEYAEKAHSRGAYLLVDATFGPPPLQDPFTLGADIVMHSGTKYIGGHSDLLCGVVVLPTTKPEWLHGMTAERLHLGSVMGSLEAWLGLRSLRTLELRVLRQSSNATQIVAYLSKLLNEGNTIVKNSVEKISHASLQASSNAEWLQKQMPSGYGPVFAIWMKTEAQAKILPSKLSLFHHATSLGGVESLVEWRKMTDPYIDGRVVRVSVGIENWEDLADDLANGLSAVTGRQ